MRARDNAQKKETAMGAEMFSALDLLEKEKGIPKDYMLEKIAQALTTAYKRDNEGAGDNCVVEPDERHKELRVYAQKTVVEEVENPAMEITLDDARTIRGGCEIGDVVNVEIKTMNFGRIAAQTAKQVIIQGIREAEAGILYKRFTASEHEILSALVSRIDPRNGNVILEIDAMRSGTDKTEAILPAGEQVRGEVLREGDRVRVYVVEVKIERNRPRVLISRTHPGLVKRLFELNVPELRDGFVEIKSISREAGSRTKMAVSATEAEIDPIGACVGPRGERVNAVVAELKGEKIDIVRYSENMEAYIAASLAPASVLKVEVAEDKKSCRVVVPDDQLSLAIGKEGQNARLAVRLTGIKIDIKSKSQDEAVRAVEGTTLEEAPAEAAEEEA
ncbi:MAG: transcription termination factor NusA [Clostridiaceae bacterium]|nr:transcription termination factor NusA [Clostridiaceae bacterium]